MVMEIFSAKSVGDIVSVAAEIPQRDSVIRWFRGVSKSSHHLIPSIWRDYSVAEERNFTNRFRVRASMRRPTVPAAEDFAAWLSIMQHFGLPTRLLDWSRSPLVAAYFATYKYLKKASTSEDAAIWILNPHALNKIEIGTNLTYPIDSVTSIDFIMPAFKDRTEPNKVIAVMSVDYDMRLFVQQGAFTVHSSRDPLDGRNDSADFIAKIEISKADVKRVALELYAAGFRRSDMFPDLANLADELRGIP